MRLTDEEIAAIKRLAPLHFGAGTVVRLVGSRVDDAARGGDIDLFVVAGDPARAGFRTECRFIVDLEEAIGEQRIDVRSVPEPSAMRALDRLALRKSALL